MTDRHKRLFAGDRIRSLRKARLLSQGDMARALGISVSYLSQIEGGDRPLTPIVLAALARAFPADWTAVDESLEAALTVDALEAGGDPSVEGAVPPEIVRRTVERQPLLARRLVALHAAFRRSQDQLRVLDDRLDQRSGSAAQLPWERVRDWFHDERNYIDPLDRAAEEIVAPFEEGAIAQGLERLLRDRYGVTVVHRGGEAGAIRLYDPAEKMLRLDPLQTAETRRFQIAYQFARLAFARRTAEIARGLPEAAAHELLATGLTNYAAGALLMPYARFRAEALAMRHDVDRLRGLFGTSFEQTCHRLSTLQRPGLPGIPLFFCRVDMAGNITKRHSATPLQFARFGGACPLWIVHEAVAIPDRILVQLAETPDGTRYISMAKGLVKPSPSFSRMPRRYAVALGCEASHAGSFVYADGVQTSGMATPIGVSCRICPREDCDQRAFPPAASRIALDPDRRGAVPYRFI
ncbi:short-chain fatty acyl-CoA regulator family protein [Aurantimonas sp. Leaf443]|uniref:helix-turn-helix domain-containing protein n=1 Tax=Aurantimonas sp. Leaf443 TaxID=1736378 RepID=UPI0006F64FE0|nr:short-chain fatty acyl-CoA regulator family protein [Aurantimonas sp. Leaf443]KQT85790.1 XRE family transcriptional regulator [Aurantimonas sp. Leaf443]